MSVSASLGQLCVHQGLLDEPERARLSELLRDAVRAGAPRSMAQLLIAEGFAREVVGTVLASGLALAGVRCDACDQAVAQEELPPRQERPCARCGSLLIGFRGFAPTQPAPAQPGPPEPGPTRPEPPDESPEGEVTCEIRVSAITDRYPHVLALPPVSSSEPPPRLGPTQRFDKVLAPAGESEDPNATPTYGVVFELPRERRGTGRGEKVGSREASRRLQRLMEEPSPAPADWSLQPPPTGAPGLRLSGERSLENSLSYDPEGATLGPGDLQVLMESVEVERTRADGPTLSPEELAKVTQGLLPARPGTSSELVTPSPGELKATLERVHAELPGSPLAAGEHQAAPPRQQAGRPDSPRRSAKAAWALGLLLILALGLGGALAAGVLPLP